MMMNNNINSKEYWDNRFASGDWEEKGGNNQTKYFYNLLLENLPESIKKVFNKENFTICDVGCAEGDGSKILQDTFTCSKVFGMDISNFAVKKAKQNHDDITFFTTIDTKYDVVISSNTLEHFEDPSKHLENLFSYAKKYVVLLVPFEEYDRVPEHFFTFEYDYFKFKYSNFNLLFFNELYCDEPTIWEGKQLLLIFKKDVSFEDLTLDSLGVASILKSRENQIFNNIGTIEKQKQTIRLKELEINRLNILNNNLNIEKESIIKKESIIEKNKNVINNQKHQLNTIYSSNMWKLAKKYYALKETSLISPFIKLSRSIKKYGILTTVKKVYSRSTELINKSQNEKKNIYELERILKKYPNETIIILPVLIDWNIPLFQRPQHLAKNLAGEGFLYFFCTDNWQYDDINGFSKVVERCYITNRFGLVDKIENRRKYYDLSSTDNITEWSFIKSKLDKGDGIIYQYIDEISEDLTGFTIPQKTWDKHDNILKDERCIVIPSATKLENDIKKYRSKNFKLVTNGVEIEHFSQNIDYDSYPSEIKKIVDKKKLIIGYFGAFATWFDYELIKRLAIKKENMEIVLLGWDYDGSIKKAEFNNYENITILGPIKYPNLPKYAACFDVSIIPFMINDITQSTSPIKLFEYMAMGKPIVTTDMPECRKYQSVLIGKDHNDFIEQIEKALLLIDDKVYLKVLKKEASENSWKAKAKDISNMIYD